MHYHVYMNPPNGWSIEIAENRIHAYARGDFDLAYTKHAKQRFEERSILISDVIHVLAHGQVVGEPQESTRAGYFKYKICGKSPNSGNREICLVIIPDTGRPAIKVVTAMWKDMR